MRKLKPAIIATGFMPAGMDSLEALERFAAMGYKGYEMPSQLLRDGKHTLEEARNKLSELGMEFLTAGFSPLNGPVDVKAVIEDCHKFGVTRATDMGSRLIMNYISNQVDSVTYDMAMQEIEEMERVATELKKEGIVACFHNHHVEFTKCYKGVPFYYLMLANTENLKMELDCGWATYAGVDPVQLMKNLGDRLCAVHIKDYTDGVHKASYSGADPVDMPCFTTPGTGYLNLKGCLQTAIDLGIDYAIVEQDYMNNLDQLSSAQAAVYNLRETGLVE